MEQLIPADKFCSTHNIEISFIRSLRENGLLEITDTEETVYINPGQLLDLERIVHLYFDLDINLEGIETIQHLLKKIIYLQDEIMTLRNRLRFYEASE